VSQVRRSLIFSSSCEDIWTSGFLLGTWSAGMVDVIDHRHVGKPYRQRRVGSKADIELAPVDVRFVPKADKVHCSNRNVIQTRYLL
jgi:hypothetical protein